MNFVTSIEGSGGETVLAFSTNPLQNVLHLAVGLGVLWRMFEAARVVLTAAGASALYLVIGLAGWSDGIGILAMNPATATLHVVLGSLGVALVIGAGAADRRGAMHASAPPAVGRPRTRR